MYSLLEEFRKNVEIWKKDRKSFSSKMGREGFEPSTCGFYAVRATAL